MFERCAEDSPTKPWSTMEGARQWHLRIGPKTYVIVTAHLGVSWFRIAGITWLENDRPVEGGPQRAANAAREEVQSMVKILGGRAA
jgi:hypothetical protein